MPEEVRSNIEADSFWCMTRVLDGIQDNYTFAQPGIQVTEYDSTHSIKWVAPYICTGNVLTTEECMKTLNI